ncbi:MAG: hypothetical protein QXH91_02410 [Candidatus Bathyarchaeia archaeon]
MEKRSLKPSSRNQSLEDKNEKLGSFLQKLIEKSREGAIILVEGLKDAKALRRIGITGKISCTKNIRIPLYDYLQEYVNSKNEIIVLTDFDRRGVQLASKMTNYLEKSGKPVNIKFWLELRGFITRDIKDVEGLASYVKTIQRKCGKPVDID